MFNSPQAMSTGLVLIGAGFMLASIVLNMRTRKNIPENYQRSWATLIGLMIFFLAGYLTFVVVQISKLSLPIELITGAVFLGGALFVFLVIRLTQNTIAEIRKGEQLLRMNHSVLEIKVERRTEELRTALDDLKKEVTERVQTGKELEKVNAELSQILNLSADGIKVVGRNFLIQRVNSTLVEMAGVPEEELVGSHCYACLSSINCHSPNCPVQRILEGEERVEMESVLTGKDGKLIPAIVTAFPYRNADGEIIGIVEGLRNITERKKMEARLQEMSVTDELTGLLNRRGFFTVAEKQLDLVTRLNQSLFLLYADIDNMKWINDNLGHSVGDEALVEVAELLCNTFRKSDIIGIGRLGGDEFAVLMLSDPQTCCDHPVLSRIEENIHEINRRPDRKYRLSMSVGIVQYDPEKPCSTEEFISRGDEAMYKCKKERKMASATAGEKSVG